MLFYCFVFTHFPVWSSSTKTQRLLIHAGNSVPSEEVHGRNLQCEVWFWKARGGEDVKWDLGKVEIEEWQRETCESLDLTQMSTFLPEFCRTETSGLVRWKKQWFWVSKSNVYFFSSSSSLSALGIMQKTVWLALKKKKWLQSCIKHKVKPAAYIKPYGAVEVVILNTCIFQIQQILIYMTLLKKEKVVAKWCQPTRTRMFLSRNLFLSLLLMLCSC